MRRSLIALALLAAVAALVGAGCGGGSGGVPEGAIAVVNGTEIPEADLDQLIDQAKAGFEIQNRDFPKAGTQEYLAYQQQLVAFLVQKEQWEQEASKLNLEITDADIDKARADLLKERFSGDEKKLADALEQQGFNDESFREALRVSVLSDKLFEVVTKDVKVTDAEALAYYTQNPDQYGSPEQRDVRHILIAEKDANGQVDYAKSKAEANRIYGLLEDGGDFAALAKEHSADTGTATIGGKYTAIKGQSVPEFDKAAFALATNEISKPVKTQFGYHIIEPIADTKPKKVTPFQKVKAAIKAQLLQDKRTQMMTEWEQDLPKQYDGKISYAQGYAPPELPDTTETQTETQ
jgi:peptidyl-prolyl cis-trans isomerase C